MPTNLHKRQEYTQRINQVLAYIRNNIEKPLMLKPLAEIACLSPYHFHRIFNAVLGEPLHQHVTRVRMENAAIHLEFTKAPIMSIASAHGYPSPQAFSKAHKQHFGVSPGESRTSGTIKRGAQNASWNAMGAKPVQLTPRNETCAERRVIYVKKLGRYTAAATAAWAELLKFAGEQSLLSERTEQIGITYDSPVVTQDEQIQYDACISSDAPIKRGSTVGAQTISGGRFAVFTHVGPYETSWRTYNAIYAEWLFESSVTLRNAPAFAHYLGGSAREELQEQRMEIYIPVE